MSQTRERLSKLVGMAKKVQITRAFPGDPLHNGFVLGLGRELVLLQQFHDFYPEGFTASRVADVKKVRSGEHERFWETMFRGEGLMDLVGIPYEVPLEDFRSLLVDLQKRGQHVIIESEDRKTEEHDDFHIGRIIDLDDGSVTILNFDPLGVWDVEPAVVGLGNITKVEFDTPYINTMTKYLKGEPPK